LEAHWVDFARTVWGLTWQGTPCRLGAVAATISQTMVMKWLFALRIHFMRAFDVETAQPISPEAVIRVEQLFVRL